MLGYAEHRDDLALGDSLHGELATGDLGSFDRDGFFRLTGRSKRIAKVFGLRVNLDEIEVIANAHGPAAATEDGEKILLWRVASTDTNSDDVRREVARRVGLNSRAVSVRDVDELPLKPSGKVDYDRLVKLGAG
jgi:acyl-CoA synthetase (AMP-forming)/AMP-acid ligase II